MNGKRQSPLGSLGLVIIPLGFLLVLIQQLGLVNAVVFVGGSLGILLIGLGLFLLSWAVISFGIFSLKDHRFNSSKPN